MRHAEQRRARQQALLGNRSGFERPLPRAKAKNGRGSVWGARWSGRRVVECIGRLCSVKPYDTETHADSRVSGPANIQSVVRLAIAGAAFMMAFQVAGK